MALLVVPPTLTTALLFLLATSITIITNTADAFQPTNLVVARKNIHSTSPPERIVTVVVVTQQPSIISTSSSTTLFAGKSGGGKKKRRRRRKESKEGGGGKQSNPPPPPPASVVPSSSMETDELPDFDLDEDIVDETQSQSAPPAATATTASGATIPPSPLTPSASTPQLDLNDPAVVAAMRSTQSNTGGGGGTKSTATTGDLLRSRNREMEQKFVVNTVTEDVPDLAQYTKNKKVLGGSVAGAGVGKKARRAAARKAAAIDANKGEKEEEGESIFSKLLPFVGGGDGDKDPDEKLDPLKLLENGTWAGIFALVAWEVYLNSPFFERATSDFAPIVF